MIWGSSKREQKRRCAIWLLVLACSLPSTPPLFSVENVCFRLSRTREAWRKQRGEKGRGPAESQSARFTEAELCLKYWGWGGIIFAPSHFQFPVTAVQCNSNNNNKWMDMGSMLSFFNTQYDSCTLNSRNESRDKSRLDRHRQ